MSFDPNADPVGIAARAAELSLEQHDRLRACLENGRKAVDFYSNPFEVTISNEIASLMSGYAVLMGYVSLARATGEPEQKEEI